MTEPREVPEMTLDHLMRNVVQVFSWAFKTPESVDAWESTYRFTLGHLTSKQLGVAFQRTMTAWKKSTPPLPADILENAPAALDGIRNAGKSMAGLGRELPVLERQVLDAWWVEHGEWFETTCTGMDLDAEQQKRARARVEYDLRNDTLQIAQHRYWHGGDRKLKPHYDRLLPRLAAIKDENVDLLRPSEPRKLPKPDLPVERDAPLGRQAQGIVSRSLQASLFEGEGA